MKLRFRSQTYGMRTVQIFLCKDRYDVELISTLRAENLSDALAKFREDYLEKLGYTDALRTGNVLGAYDRDGKYKEFFARDKPALI